MPGKEGRNLGYNWRARQTRKSDGGRKFGSSEARDDPNALVLPAMPKRAAGAGEEAVSRRKRLSCKQRKRLQKILEVREKKTKRAQLLSDLTTLSLTPSQLSHLHPSTSLSSGRPPTLPSSSVRVCEGRLVQGWRVRRRQRKRRQLRAEKEAWSPRPDLHVSSSSEMDTSGDEEEEEDEGGSRREKGTEETQQLGVSELSEEKDACQDQQNLVTGGGAVAMETGVPLKRVAVFVQLDRPSEVEESRSDLPVVGEEGRVMEMVGAEPVTVLCGETGSGKTTQLPQFLYEHGYTLPNGPCGGGMIVVTEPRRVAAVTMSQRVAYEMGLSQRQVSYQIRHEGNVTEETVIKFVTDGVLLKEIEQDFLLERYSVVVVDEAHERSVFTDILIGLLSRILPLREKTGRPLKLVVMSATLRVKDFTNNTLFPSPPPTLSVESRQYPVTVHFSRRTLTSYQKEVYRKVCRVHRELPAGHLLVFLTGQREVLRLCRLLQETFPSSHPAGQQGEREGGRRRRKTGDVDLDRYPLLPPTGEEEEEEDEEEEEEEDGDWEEAEVSVHDQQLPMKVLPLYSLLSSERQSEVWQLVSEGVRLCVVATNIAETSLTIPGIKYVVDTGKVKMRYYDKVTGISTFRVEWVSKASANQRAGRAGRTQPGHCYRLYSSAVFENEFDQFSEPEICRRPVEDLVLQLKALGIERVTNFPFPTPPSLEALQAAERVLVGLGALSAEGRLTELGRTISQFSLAPRYGKMLALGHQHGCLPYIISLVSALSVKELLAGIGRRKRGLGTSARKGDLRELGELGELLVMVGAASHSEDSRQFCRITGVDPRAIRELSRITQQLTNSVNLVCPDLNLTIDPKLAPPTQHQVCLLRQIVLAGLADHVARKMSGDGMIAEDKRKLRLAYQCSSCEGPVYLPPTSPLAPSPPDYLVYLELVESGDRISLRGVVAIEEAWLPLMAPQFCSFSPPLEVPPPTFDRSTGTIQCHVNCTYGRHRWQLPPQQIVHPPGLQLYRLFALFLLQGKVCPALAKFSSFLLLPPITMVKSWAKLHRETDVLLKALVEREVTSRQALLQQWEKEPKYLLKAVSLWLPQSKHTKLVSIWPPT